MYGKAYSNLLISENAFNTVCRLEEELAPVFRRIESIECENEAKVLAAFHKNRVAAHYFNPTTGYGYDDIGSFRLLAQASFYTFGKPIAILYKIYRNIKKLLPLGKEFSVSVHFNVIFSLCLRFPPARV